MAQTGTATVTLINRSRRMQVFNLPYQIAGLKYCTRQLVGRVVYDSSTGAKRVRGENKRLSDSLTLMGRGQDGDTAHQLPPAVLDCPEVESALKGRTLRALELNSEESTKQASELRVAELKRAKAKEQTAIFLKNKAELKASSALARAAAAGKPAGPTKAEIAAKAAEEKRLAEEQAAAKAAEEKRLAEEQAAAKAAEEKRLAGADKPGRGRNK